MYVGERMKKSAILLAVATCFFTACDLQGTSGTSGNVATKTTFETDAEKLSYGIGYNTITGLQGEYDGRLDEAALIQAIRDHFTTTERRIPDSTSRIAHEAMVKAIQAEYPIKNTKFLEDNKVKEGVVTTESGLQYKVIKEGTGANPLATDMVEVHYTGKLINGTTFDSSVPRGKPAKFSVGQVIKGWTEGLQLMNVGSKYEFYIPSDLAYGPQGAGRQIKGNSTLIFEVELLNIEKPEAPKDTAAVDTIAKK